MASVFPLFFLFLLGTGSLLSPVAAEDEIFDGAEDMAEEGREMGYDMEEDMATLPLDDVKVQIDINAMSLSHLNNLLIQLLDVLSQNPCSENEVADQVTQVMEDGFTATLNAFREAKRSLRMLKLISWRMDFIQTLDIPKISGDGPCPFPFFMLNGECIYVETKVRRSMRDASIACSAMGGSLIEPADLQNFADYIRKMNLGGDKEVLIGGVDLKKSGTWRWLSGGIIEDDIPWASNRPNTHEFLDCLSVKDSHYRDLSCFLRRIYACERPL